MSRCACIWAKSTSVKRAQSKIRLTVNGYVASYRERICSLLLTLHSTAIGPEAASVWRPS